MAGRPLPIPDADRPWLDGFLREHPEMAERMAELAKRDREMRDFAETVIGEIYEHYTTGAPSRRGLIISLRAFLQLLEDEDRAVRA